MDPYSGLWIDGPDALTIASAEGGWLREALLNFVSSGFAIIPEAVPPADIDGYLAELAGLSGARSGLQALHGSTRLPLEDADLSQPGSRLLDSYAFAPSALKMIFSAKLEAFLGRMFEDDLLAFQSLHFEVGSTQAIHQDTSYVVIDTPLNLAASWIALEDVEPGSGELTYYPGSHRFPHQLYAGTKHWSRARDGEEIHSAHLSWLHEEASARGISRELFRPKKGDALVWHADLAHGGSPISNPVVTRRSLVTHYCPVRNTPHYFQFTSRNAKIAVGPGKAISSFYYDLPTQWLGGADPHDLMV